MTTISPVLIGIDPGLKGAIAIFAHGTPQVHDMPRTPLGLDLPNLYSILRRAIDGPTVAALEYPERAATAARPSDVATFWEQVGAIEGILTALGIKYMRVTPRAWKDHFNCHARTPAEAKLKSTLKAKTLYPEILFPRKDGGRADAILIGLYAKGYADYLDKSEAR